MLRCRLLLLLPLLILGGCDSGNSDSDATAAVVGTWEGEVDQTFITYPMVMVIDGLTEGEQAGTTAYPTLPCSGVIGYDGRDGDTYVFTEEITSNAAGCIAEGEIRVELLDEDTLDWDWHRIGSSSPFATATLTRR